MRRAPESPKFSVESRNPERLGVSDGVVGPREKGSLGLVNLVAP